MGTDIEIAKLPVSLCRGPLKFGDVVLDAHVLDDETRLITKRTAIAALTGADGGKLERYLDALPKKHAVSPVGQVSFRIPTNGGPVTGHGISGETFVSIVKAYAEAFVSGELHTQQRHIGERCVRIMFALANVAIAAMIDQATGYAARNYAREIERKIATYLLPAPAEWELMFPSEFFTLLCKLFRIQRNGTKNPAFVQWFIHEYVYASLDADVARAVKERNPNPRFGSNHHQHYSDRARVLLNAHIAKLLTVMKQSASKEDFYMRFAVEFKGAGLQLPLPTKSN